MKRRVVWPTLAVALFLAFPVMAGRLADLPWDAKQSVELRNGCRRAMEREADALKKAPAPNAKSVRVFPSFLFDPLPEGRVAGFVTVETCLPERMVTETWRLTLAPKGHEYEVVAREKIGTTDAFERNVLEKVGEARPVKPFTFQHDQMTLKVDSGSMIRGFHGKKIDTLLIAGSGRFQIKPLNDYEKLFFLRRLDHDAVDTEITEIRITHHEDDPQFVTLAGAAAEGPATGPGSNSSGLDDLYDDEMRLIKGREDTPYAYSPPARPEFKGMFEIRVKTKDFGWLEYDYNPMAPTEIEFYQLVSQLGGSNALNRWETRGISRYKAPETRKLPMIAQDRRREFRFTDASRFDAMINVEPDNFIGRASIDLMLMIDTDYLQFGIAGNPTVQRVQLNGKDLVFVPRLSIASAIYGFQETANSFYVQLPQKFTAGTKLRLDVAFESPNAKGSQFQRIVNMITDDYWEVQRGGFLPFLTTISDPSYMHFVIRTGKAYQHVTIGSKLSDEYDADAHYTEWGSDAGFNFATIAIGKYFDPIERESDGIKFTGFMNRHFFGVSQQSGAAMSRLPEPQRSDMEPQVEQAAAAAHAYATWFGTPYPFRDLKLVSSPFMGMSAQSPTSIVFIGEFVFWSDQNIAEFFKGMDPTWAHSVTAHETAHQWFGGMVAHVNGDNYWFIESFAELASAYYREATNDATGLKNNVAYWRNNSLAFDWQKALIDDTTREEPGSRDVLLRYTKGPLVFWMLREYYGERKVLAFLGNLVRSLGGDLVGTGDVQRVAEQTFGEPMDWFFDQYVRGLGIPEVSYRFDAPRPAEDGKGWIITGKLKQRIMVKNDALPGKVFKHLMVPVHIETEKGLEKPNPIINSAEETVTMRLEGKPKGSLKVNPDNVAYMTLKEM